MDIPVRIRKEMFIRDYLNKNVGVDAVDTEFHEQWFRTFGGKRKETNWGCQISYDAMRCIKNMYNQGILIRGIITLGNNWQPGFPKWVYSYSLSERYKR